MDLIVTIILYCLSKLVWPMEEQKSITCSKGDNWIVFDDFAKQNKLNDIDKNDPMLNGECDDGPEW